MNQKYIVPDKWSIIEEGFDKTRVKASESLFSLGNGAMGQRANFEETYTGPTFRGSYIAGVYYPDKTRVGWWKNGYPEYFAKVLNAPNWIGIEVKVNDETVDLNKCREVKRFRRELNMKEGWYKRVFEVVLNNGIWISVSSLRFLSLDIDEVGAIRYEVEVIEGKAEVEFVPYIDAGVENEDTNWEERFWEVLDKQVHLESAYIVARTKKTDFIACTFMRTSLLLEEKEIEPFSEAVIGGNDVKLVYKTEVREGKKAVLFKYGGYVTSRSYERDQLIDRAKEVIVEAGSLGFEALLHRQKKAWSDIWEMADITIEGDIEAQQGIRFNIFQLNQTYLGKDDRLNIGPKGFTGEKYGGSTYWDTEAYCLPFYMATKSQEVARNLLQYRYNHLQKAIENAEKLGFSNGAALYPMVTMNGEECHNEWEITFEEIHRNGAIAFAIFNYYRFTGDYSYIPEMGLEVLIGIARFWHQRSTFSKEKEKYVILGVTGPNEYENNVNNNFYTNYIAKWCIEYTVEQIHRVKRDYFEDYKRIITLTNLQEEEIVEILQVAENMYFPYSEKYNVYLQQDGFLDKELTTASQLDESQRPINQHWSWDRILRSPYIKQADTLQGFYFFEEHFTREELERHFDFYEPFTVHESSLSPCVHSILAAVLNRMEQAYRFYLRTSRLDLDDYNKEVHEGLHITSMAGTWMSIVEGFGGMRMKEGKLSFEPKIPVQWQSYSFKVNFRNQVVKVFVKKDESVFEVAGTNEVEIMVNREIYKLTPEGKLRVKLS